MASQSHASVPFYGLFSSPVILALTTNLFISVVSSSLYPQNPFCKYKPEPSSRRVKINQNSV